MSEELEGTEERSGLGRRDFLRRSAIVGGMVWAAPMIQSAPAFAQAFTPDGEENGDCIDVSYVALVLQNASDLRLKIEDKNGGCEWENPPGVGQLPSQCADFPNFVAMYTGATPADGGNYIDVDCTDDCVWTFTVKSGLPYTIAGGVVKGGQKCIEVVIAADGKSATGGPIPK